MLHIQNALQEVSKAGLAPFEEGAKLIKKREGEGQRVREEVKGQRSKGIPNRLQRNPGGGEEVILHLLLCLFYF